MQSRSVNGQRQLIPLRLAVPSDRLEMAPESVSAYSTYSPRSKGGFRSKMPLPVKPTGSKMVYRSILGLDHPVRRFLDPRSFYETYPSRASKAAEAGPELEASDLIDSNRSSPYQEKSEEQALASGSSEWSSLSSIEARVAAMTADFETHKVGSAKLNEELTRELQSLEQQVAEMEAEAVVAEEFAQNGTTAEETAEILDLYLEAPEEDEGFLRGPTKDELATIDAKLNALTADLRDAKREFFSVGDIVESHDKRTDVDISPTSPIC